MIMVVNCAAVWCLCACIFNCRRHTEEAWSAWKVGQDDAQRATDDVSAIVLVEW